MLAAGEKKLLAAVLARAARDAVNPIGELSSKHNVDAIRFFGLDTPVPQTFIDTSEGFSFGYICEALELCPYIIHKNLQALLDEKRATGIRFPMAKILSIHIGEWVDAEDQSIGGVYQYGLPNVGGAKAAKRRAV